MHSAKNNAPDLKEQEKLEESFKAYYQKVRFRALDQMTHPLVFAYSAFVDPPTRFKALKYGFVKCLESGLGPQQLDEIVETELAEFM